MKIYDFNNQIVKITSLYTYALFLPLLVIHFNIIFISKSITLNMLSSIFFIFFVLIITAIGFHKKINIKIAIISCIYITFLITSLFIAKSIDSFMSFAFNINILISGLSFFLIYGFIDDIILQFSNFYKLIINIVIIGICFCVFNLVANIHIIMNLNNITSGYEINMISFFPGRNQFAVFLFFEIIFISFLICKFKKYNYLLILGLFLFNLFCTFTRASILSTLIFLIYIIITTCNRKQKLYLLIFSGILILFFIYNSEVVNYIIKYIIRPDTGSAGRTIRWGVLLNYVFNNIEILILGASPIGMKSILEILINSGQIDNAYLEVLATGGIPKLLFYIYFIVDSFKTTIKIKRIDKIAGNIFQGATISFTVYSFFESVILLESGILPWLATIVIIILPKWYYNAITLSASSKNG